MDNVQKIFVLMYRRHKLLDLILNMSWADNFEFQSVGCIRAETTVQQT
jgi:hypothetical protein